MKRRKQPSNPYIELLKPRIMTMVMVTATIGFYLGGIGIHNWPLFIATLLGVGMTCGGSGALNHYIEQDADRKMDRTRNRPVASGRIPAEHALFYGVYLVMGGVLLLVWQVGVLTAFLALLSAFLYVLVYTPMKRITWANTLAGAVPGALPPMGGWAAATGQLDAGAWVLFAIMFIWQQPHFYAIAWMYREDYQNGGFKMLPGAPNGTRRTFRHILVFSIALIPASLAPAVLGLSGPVYIIGALALGLMMLWPAIVLCRTHEWGDARRVLRMSVIYLPLWLILFVADFQF